MTVMKVTALKMLAGAFCVCSLMLSPGAYAAPGQATDAHKERLVLMPLRVAAEDGSMQGAMEAAVVQGLQSRYVVFAGEQVSRKVRDIFRRESRAAKQDCNETRCMEDIAIAFQSELIAVANVTRVDGGYLLALSIRNVMDDKAVYSNSMPCRGCDVFQVVERLKLLGGPVSMATAPTPPESAANPDTESADDALLVTGPEVSEDERKSWQMAQDRHSVSAVQAYLDKYPNGRYVRAAKRRLQRLQDEEAAAAQNSSGVSADERLRQAEQAGKDSEVSPIRVIPKYLQKVIPELIEH